jgi:hypothetical protein
MAELVGLNSEVPDILPKLSQLLQIQQQQTQLAGSQQSQRQRAALAKYDFGKHVGEDGTVDLNSLTTDPELRAAAGDQYLEVLSHAATAKQAQLQAKSSLYSLRGDQVSGLGQMITPLLSDPDVAQDNEKGRQKVNEAWMQYGQLYGDEALPVLRTFAAPLKNAPQGKMQQALRMIQMQAMDVEKQRQARLPDLVNKGGSLTNVNPDVATDAPTDIALTLPPGASIVTDQTGAQFILNPQTNQVTPVGGGRAGGPAPNVPPSRSFKQPTYAGQAEDISNYQHEVANTRAAADAAPANRNIFQHILSLADETNTGPLVSYIQNNAIGGQVFGDNYQELGKYLEKNAIANMQAMGGPPSDARLSAAVAANGSTKFNPKALKAVTQFNYATNTGLERYRQGLDKAVGLKDQDYSKLPQFKADWAKNFDIDAFRLENAVADGNKAMQREILDGLTPARRKEIARKLKNLDALAETGQLPQ